MLSYSGEMQDTTTSIKKLKSIHIFIHDTPEFFFKFLIELCNIIEFEIA
jgi:hypothetical protein